MSETGQKIYKASQIVENTLASGLKDFESGIGSFFSSTHARSHGVEEVPEQAKGEAKPEQAAEVTDSIGAASSAKAAPVRETPVFSNDDGAGL